MSVSVVIPLYNGEKHVVETLESVLSQKIDLEEVAVVDDGSTDSSVSIAKKYSEVDLYKNPENGPNTARNYGLRKTTAEKVAFIDHDDLWHPEHLQRLSRSLENEPDSPVAIASKTDFQDGEDPQYSIKSYEYGLRDPWEGYPGNPFGEPCLALIRRDALRDVGGWPEHYWGSGDTYMWHRLGLLGPSVVNRSITAARRVFQDSKSSTQRTDQMLEYYEQLVDISNEVLKIRKEKGLSIKPYESSFQAQEATLELLKVLSDEEGGSLERAATQFDRSVSEMPQENLGSMLGTFKWHIRPRVREVGTQNFASQLLDLVDRWPYAESQLRNLLQEWAFSLTPAPDLVRRYPWRLSSWRCLADRVYKKLRQIPAR
ncbi:glycosyltransferase family 2 protein [Salinibacter ruber]|uniref:glycosyltransferase family 2 protein n=1 Tax=Salinibacter ruber TaxID=146919 RepID=UPI0021670E3A|nr:glycosyltransferase involved in cell wall biosynthesis [Salinibacter ruber]